MQLRSAKKFGFDFESHSQDKVGTIRAFVRKKKDEERKQQALAKATPSPCRSSKTEPESTGDADCTKSRASPPAKTPRKIPKKREFKPRAAKAAAQQFFN